MPENLYAEQDKVEEASPGDDSFEDQDQLNFYANLMNNNENSSDLNHPDTEGKVLDQSPNEYDE